MSDIQTFFLNKISPHWVVVYRRVKGYN